jgi:hypothetical protein
VIGWTIGGWTEAEVTAGKDWPRTVLFSGRIGGGTWSRCLHLGQVLFLPAWSSGASKTDLHFGQANRIMSSPFGQRLRGGLPALLCSTGLLSQNQ